MKISKVFIVVLSLCFLGGILFAAKPYDIQANIKNAVQHIQQHVQLLNGENSVKIVNEADHVNISETSNFLLTGNDIESSRRANILGGQGNKVLGLSGGAILGGKNNMGQSDYSIVNGGEKNKINSDSNSSVIMGGVKNTVDNNSDFSVIVGGSNNRVKGRYSAVAGKNSVVSGNSSVALGSDVTVKGNNSFLWSDGSKARELSEDSVFVVVSEHGMVVNTGEAPMGVQLTVGGSLVVGQKAGLNIKCEGGEGAGIVVLTGKDTYSSVQKCLCSCDGYGWHSLLGDGQCEIVCNGSNNQSEPKCGSGLSVVKNGSGLWTYVGTCEQGFPINDSYRESFYTGFDDLGNLFTGDKVQWVCQQANGNVSYSGCEYVIKCEGTIPGLGESKQINNNIIPSLDPSVNREYKYSDDPGVLCSYSCKEGYLWTGGDCRPICNKSAKRCYIGVYSSGNSKDWFNNSYYYNCSYVYNGNIHTQKCDMECDGAKIWNGSSCVNRDDACGTSGYSCNFGIPSKTYMDEGDRVSKYFTWSCDYENGTPIQACSKAKTTGDKSVYFHVSEVGTIKTVWFSVDGALSGSVNIKLPYTVNGGNFVDNYVIAANTETSQKRNYDSSLSSITLNTPYFGEDEIVQGEMVYKLKIVNGSSANNHCAESCSTAGQCLGGATSSNYTSSINGNNMNFTWKCGTQSCSTSCHINTSSCSKKPSGATSCDATADSECIPLSSQTISINKDDFYMYSAEEVISSSACGTKRHCVKGSSGYVNYTMETQYCTQNGFKCNYGKVLSGCDCVNVCTSTSGVGKCNGGATATLPGATWTTGYDYTCTLRSNTYNCSATCPTGKYWNGSACVSAPSLCGSTHYNCTNGARMTENAYISSSHSYKWKCTIGDINTQCRDCEDGYILSGSVCVPKTLGCEENYNLNGYRVPAMSHGESKTVTRVDSIQKCTNTATCTNGNVTLGTESCVAACNKATNPGTCNLGLSVTSRTGTIWGYSYTYRCGDFSCGVTCDSGKIWDGNQCVDKLQPLPLCGSTANTCLQGTPQNKTSNEVGDTRNCLDAQNNKINVSGVCYKCKSGYIWNGSKCAKSCKTADNKTWTGGKVGDAYIGTGHACPSSCDSAKASVKCDDGDFVYNTYPYEKVTVPVYNDCITEGAVGCFCDNGYIWSGDECVLLSNCNIVSHDFQAPNVDSPYYVSNNCNDQYCVYQMIMDERNHWSDWGVGRYNARVGTVYVAPYSSETVTTRYDAVEYCDSLDLLGLNRELPHAYLAFYPQMTNKRSNLYQLTAQGSEKSGHYWASNGLTTTDTNCAYNGGCGTNTSNQKLSVRCIAWVDYNVCN